MHDTFAKKPDSENVPSVEQILNEEDKKEEETKQPSEPEEKKESGPDLENMSLTEQLELAKK